MLVQFMSRDTAANRTDDQTRRAIIALAIVTPVGPAIDAVVARQGALLIVRARAIITRGVVTALVTVVLITLWLALRALVRRRLSVAHPGYQDE